MNRRIAKKIRKSIRPAYSDKQVDRAFAVWSKLFTRDQKSDRAW